MDRGQEQPPLWAVVTVGCCVTSIAIPPPWQISLDWGKAPRMSLPQVTEVGCKSVKLHQSHQYSRLQCKVLTVIRCRGPVERVVGCSQTETRPNSCRVAKLKDQPSNRWNSENSVAEWEDGWSNKPAGLHGLAPTSKFLFWMKSTFL